MFKKCSFCGQQWLDIDQFIADRNLQFIGYQPAPKVPGEGLFLFLHYKEDCKTTLGIKVRLFHEKFSPGETLEEFIMHGPDCPGFCDQERNLEPCLNDVCNGSVIRQLMQKLKVLLPFLAKED